MEKEYDLNIPEERYPMLNRYSKERVMEMLMGMLKADGETEETITSKKLGSAAANLESDLQHMFP